MKIRLRLPVQQFLFLVLLSGCASGPPAVPYPAFAQVDEMPDVFLAALPGLRAKQLSGDARSGRNGYRLLLPADWNGSTGASPGKSVELFVVAGEITLGGMELKTGSYAYIPAGFTGSSFATTSGAMVLYFLDNENSASVIQTPLIMDSGVLNWQAVSDEPEDFGLSIKELRLDPGSGARTWLLRIDPGAVQSWQRSATPVEGYLLTGSYRHSECVNGESATFDYAPSGYFVRPAGAINAGPEAAAWSTAIWYLRSIGKSDVQTQIVSACIAEPAS